MDDSASMVTGQDQDQVQTPRATKHQGCRVTMIQKENGKARHKGLMEG